VIFVLFVAGYFHALFSPPKEVFGLKIFSHKGHKKLKGFFLCVLCGEIVLRVFSQVILGLKIFCRKGRKILKGS